MLLSDPPQNPFSTASVISARGGRSHTKVYVRFAPKADKRAGVSLSPLCANSDHLRGLATPPIGAIVRVPAPDIEAVVSKALFALQSAMRLPCTNSVTCWAGISAAAAGW